VTCDRQKGFLIHGAHALAEVWCAHVQYEDDDDDDGDIKGPATHAVKIVGVVVGAGRVCGHAFFCL